MKNPFENAMTQLKKAVKIIDLDESVFVLLRQPQQIHEVSIPVKMDNSSLKTFRGYRVQYNNARGPYKGGIRFHPQVDIEEVKALSFWMAIKCAVVNLPYGGGKGGVEVNPQELSESELEKLARGYVEKMYRQLGPDRDIPAPDVYTNPKIMGWMMDEYSQLAGKVAKGSFTGKAVEIGGIKARESATAKGGFILLEKMREDLGKNASEMKVAIQGFGNAGYIFANFAYEAGYQIVGISDSRGAVLSKNSELINPQELFDYKRKKGSIENFCEDYKDKNFIAGSNEDLLTMECDILVPAAIENQITEDNADGVKAEIILELANGPVTPEADDILSKKNITVVPDVLANAGGVTVSYFEWVQNLQNFVWSDEENDERLRSIMIGAYDDVLVCAEKYETNYREACFVLAVERIGEAMKGRGWV
ncbi:MAG: Glu/Leu/Phe/Val dehydrogenase [Candidatus Moranbacteria bacterium]|nr:Glu/Leu/Phe/Val dehydrogenase [Candidatus Moranbacteria bacterium]